MTISFIYQYSIFRHKELVRQILDIFGKKICPCPMDKKISLRSLTDNGHQVSLVFHVNVYLSHMCQNELRDLWSV